MEQVASTLRGRHAGMVGKPSTLYEGEIMDIERAEQILKDSIDHEGLYNLGRYIVWSIGDKEITLDGLFTVEELEAIVCWVKHKMGEER